MVYSGMTEPAPTETANLDRYGDPALEWSRARDALAAVPSPDATHFLGTCRPDGTPHAAVDGDAFTAPFNAPSAGPPPWHVYRFTFHTVVGVATTEPYGATRWRFQR